MGTRNKHFISREFWRAGAFIAAFLGVLLRGSSATVPAVSEFRKSIEPLLTQYCYDCHADGANKGGIAFDELKTDEKILDSDLWLRVLKNVRAGLMPPQKKPRPSDGEKQILEHWIKYGAFALDPANPDPGRVTVRRLNRMEYKNTIRDLMGVEFDAESEFPADDTGYGFDNIADALTLSPMLLEKYLDAAKTIVSRAVPTTGGIPAEKKLWGRSFAGERKGEGGLSLSYYDKSVVSNKFKAEIAGHYQITLELMPNEKIIENEFAKCRVIFRLDGAEAARVECTHEEGKGIRRVIERVWEPGEHQISVEIEPLAKGELLLRSMTVRLDAVTVRGPMEEKLWVRPANHERFFDKNSPKTTGERRIAARRLLKDFASKAYRRPVDDQTVDRLAKLAESVYQHPGTTFETGIGQAMVAVLASPGFLFREEPLPASQAGAKFALLDEYSLASRLSYFLWSSLPDAELFKLCQTGELRKNLTGQVKRMLEDSRSKAFVRNFTGQWLQTRDVESIPIDARAILAREEKGSTDYQTMRARFRELRLKSDEGLSPAEKDEFNTLRKRIFRDGTELTGEMRQAMRRESETYFSHLIRGDRTLLELVDSDYTFLNERLAKHYGLTNLLVKGDEMRQVKLPPDSSRGGVLTMASVLVVTSNPTRTSPVKRGLFVLDNILGMPPPPPPPDIPPLEDAVKKVGDREPTLREMLEFHRAKPLCSSCHNRMDPLGLAMENFNALGVWRNQEGGQPIQISGQLLTGEKFESVSELKQILVKNHHREIYQCVTEKLLTYALGRGLGYLDVETVDKIVDELEKEGGRFSILLDGIIQSAPFQKVRTSAMISQADEPRKTPAAPAPQSRAH